MRTPASVGLPEDKFPSWRKGQDRALRDLLFSEDRFNLLCIPCGGGKSAIAMGYAGVNEGERLLYLTATKALQDQVHDEFLSMGLVDVRGRQNYVCNIDNSLDASEAVCTAGVYCELMKKGGCDYYDAVRVAKGSRIVVTNYRFWLHAEESGSLGQFTTLVLDEAHRCESEISDFAAVEITGGELRRFGIRLPPGGVAAKNPSRWGSLALEIIDRKMVGTKEVEKRKALRNLQRRLARLCRLSNEEWLGSAPRRDVWRWDLVDPGALAEELLFRGAKRIILASASVRRKTLQLLGVESKVKVLEQESTFPVRRRPVYYWPVARVGRKMTSGDRAVLHEAIDEFIEPRLDRKGIVHSVSYEFAREIWQRSRHQARMLLHDRRDDTARLLRKFKLAPPGTILVSPAVGTGNDFPADQCEFQVIPKMPFPSLGSPLVRARATHDPDYSFYVTMQSLVQMVGRGMRSADDQCESAILDANLGWVRARYWDFAPRWWHAATRTVKKDERPPDPPPPLRRAE